MSANGMAREVEALKQQLAEYEPLNPQQCPKGLHADWLVDSEYTHACPWCALTERDEKHDADVSQLSEELHRRIQHEKDGKARWRARAEKAEALKAQLAELTARAHRVAVSHEHFIQDHTDPGTEALAAQYELINWLSASQHHEGLPVNPVENALRIILATLDQFDENATPGEIRATLAEALPRDDMSDRRRRIYVDGRGDGWLDQSVASDGTRWIAPLAGSMPTGAEPEAEVAKRTGSLREIGRCW